MFGFGGQELVIIGLLLLIVFGPARVGQMARDVGRFAYRARSSVEEFKAQLRANGSGSPKPGEGKRPPGPAR